MEDFLEMGKDMANPEHVKILEQGVEIWNKWWDENVEVRPDLSGAVIGRSNKWGSCQYTMAVYTVNNTLTSKSARPIYLHEHTSSQ